MPLEIAPAEPPQLQVPHQSGDLDGPAWRGRLSYGIGSVGTGIFTTVPSVLLLYFLTTQVGIRPVVAGLIILMPKMIGLIGDPLVGRWSDYLRATSSTERRLLMIVGALMTGAGLGTLFSVPEMHHRNAFIPSIIYIVCTTGYSFFAVPYAALPAELERKAERYRALVSTRLTLAFLGTLIGGVTGPLLVAHFGYLTMGVVLGTTCLCAMFAFILTCKVRLNVSLAERSRTTVQDVLLVVRGPFNRRVIAFVLLLAAAGAFTSLLPFEIRDMRASTDIVGLAMLVNIGSALVASLIWPLLIRRMHLDMTWYCAASLMALGAIGVAFAPGIGLVLFLGMAAGGAGFCGVQMAGFMALAEVTAVFESNEKGGGMLTGVWMAGEKAGLAFGPLLAGLGLQYVRLQISGSTSRSLIALIPTSLVVLSILTIGLVRIGSPTRHRHRMKVGALS